MYSLPAAASQVRGLRDTLKKSSQARVALQHHPWVRCGAQKRDGGGGAARNGGLWARLCVGGSIGCAVQANFLARRALCDVIVENMAPVAPLRSVSARAGARHRGASLADATCAPSAKFASVLWIQAVTAFDGLPRAAGRWRNSSKIATTCQSRQQRATGRARRMQGMSAQILPVSCSWCLGHPTGRTLSRYWAVRRAAVPQPRGDSSGAISVHAYPPRPSLAARQILCLAFDLGL